MRSKRFEDLRSEICEAMKVPTILGKGRAYGLIVGHEVAHMVNNMAEESGYHMNMGAARMVGQDSMQLTDPLFGCKVLVTVKHPDLLVAVTQDEYETIKARWEQDEVIAAAHKQMYGAVNCDCKHTGESPCSECGCKQLAPEFTLYPPADKCAEHAKIMLDYANNAMRTLSPFELYKVPPPELFHSVAGIMTESGELMDALKRYCFYGDGNDLDKVNIAEEYGDLLWYIALGCKYLGLDMHEIMDQNIRKLATRYPDKFNSADARYRNLQKERSVLEDMGIDIDKERKLMLEEQQIRRDMDVHAPGLTHPIHGVHSTGEDPFALPGSEVCSLGGILATQNGGDVKVSITDASKPEPLSRKADRDQYIHATLMELMPEVECVIHDPNTTKDEKQMHLQLINAIDAFCETDGGKHASG